jgi:hypothetical protein
VSSLPVGGRFQYGLVAHLVEQYCCELVISSGHGIRGGGVMCSFFLA